MYLEGGSLGGVAPIIWGASGWYILHKLAFAESFATIHDAREFYGTLKYILPCNACRENIKKHIACLPPPTRLRDLSKWVSAIHNRVNKCLGKPIRTMEYFRNEYREISLKKEEAFVHALSVTHPGMRAITPEHERALATFLRHMTGLSQQSPTFNIRSRRKFIEWVKNRY